MSFRGKGPRIGNRFVCGRRRLADYPITKTDKCWIFGGPLTSAGYGQVSYGYAHRLAWIEANGPIPKGMWVLHRCDNPPCVRVDHLFLGDSRANIEDCMAKGRWPKAHRHGLAKLTEENVLDIRRCRYLSKIVPGGSITQLSREFGISNKHVKDIAKGPNGTSWLHLYEIRGLS